MLTLVTSRSQLALGLTAAALGAAGLALLAVPPAVAAPAAGQFCSPHGAVHKTAAVTLLCSQTKKDARYRWRSIAAAGPRGATGPRGPRGPVGPVGAAGPAMACSSPYAVRKLTFTAPRYVVKACASPLPTASTTRPRPSVTSPSPVVTTTVPTPTGTPTPTPTPAVDGAVPARAPVASHRLTRIGT